MQFLNKALIELKHGQTLLFEGDSLTSRLSSPAHDTWPYLRLLNWQRTYADVIEEWLFCNLPEFGFQFRNSAVAGSSMGEILARFDINVPVIRPDWIIMTTMCNDGARGVTQSQFRHELLSYANSAYELCGVRLFIIGNFPALDNRNLAEYYTTAREVLTETHGVWFDIGEPLRAKEQTLTNINPVHTIFSDGEVHFNEVGNQIIAFLVLEAMGVLRLPH